MRRKDYCGEHIGWDYDELRDSLSDILTSVAETSLRCGTSNIYEFDEGSLNFTTLILGAKDRVKAAEIIIREEIIDPEVVNSIKNSWEFDDKIMSKIKVL